MTSSVANQATQDQENLSSVLSKPGDLEVILTPDPQPPKSSSTEEDPKPTLLDPFLIDGKFAQSVRDALKASYDKCSLELTRTLNTKFNNNNIIVSYDCPSHITVDGLTRPAINMSLVEGLGKLLLAENLSIEQLVQIVRHEHPLDTRPNKRMDPAILDYLYQDYIHHDLMVDIAKKGFDPVFHQETPLQKEAPPNHKSATNNLAALAKHIRAGQEDGSMLVLPSSFYDRWKDDPTVHIHVSPFCVVPKKGEQTSTDGRAVGDQSFPRGSSMNELTVKELIPKTEWRPAATVGKRIHELAIRSGWDPLKSESSRIRAFAGDIWVAFRNMFMRAKKVVFFGFLVPELGVLILDMAATFGWTGSPSYYGVFGNGVSWLVRRESPYSLNPHLTNDNENFFCYEWVDDYILVELDDPGRLEAAETALKLAMTLTFGHTAIHPKKFSTQWDQMIHYLGLDWCLKTCTVSMPQDKIDKAMTRVTTMINSESASKTQLQQVVGTLRHVCTCIPAARPFYQRLQSACNLLPGRRALVAGDILADCLWFKVILEHGQLQSIPVSIFADTTPPDVHFYMDACDAGLIVLHPARQRYIYVEFDADERAAIAEINNRATKRGTTRVITHTVNQPERSYLTNQIRFNKRKKNEVISTNENRSIDKRIGQPVNQPEISYSANQIPFNKRKENEVISTNENRFIDKRIGNKDFSINVREFFSVFLATMLWVPELAEANRMIHVKSWIDNSAAVAWTNKLASPNELAQQLLRVMCLTLAKYRIHISSDHIPGEWNFMPDHGSRMALSKPSADIWKAFSLSWSRTHVPPDLRHAYRCESANISEPHWPLPHAEPTLAPGMDGPNGHIQCEQATGYTKTRLRTPRSYYATPHTSTNGKNIPTELLPSCPRSALLRGIIRPPETSKSDSPSNTRLMSKAWPDPGSPTNGPSRLLQPCFAATTKLSVQPLDETTPFGAALSSPSFSACEPASTQVLPPKRSITSANKTCNSIPSMGTLPVLSKKRNLSTSSLEAARPTKKHEVAPDHSLDQATPSFARSSLRGACEILEKRSKPGPLTHCVSTLPTATNDTMYQSPSSQTLCEKQRDTAGKTQSSSRHTPSEAEERRRCSSEEVPTQPSNSLDVGSRMLTNSTSASKPARTSVSHLK